MPSRINKFMIDFDHFPKKEIPPFLGKRFDENPSSVSKLLKKIQKFIDNNQNENAPNIQFPVKFEAHPLKEIPTKSEFEFPQPTQCMDPKEWEKYHPSK